MVPLRVIQGMACFACCLGLTKAFTVGLYQQTGCQRQRVLHRWDTQNTLPAVGISATMSSDCCQTSTAWRDAANQSTAQHSRCDSSPWLGTEALNAVQTLQLCAIEQRLHGAEHTLTVPLVLLCVCHTGGMCDRLCHEGALTGCVDSCACHMHSHKSSILAASTKHRRVVTTCCVGGVVCMTPCIEATIGYRSAPRSNQPPRHSTPDITATYKRHTPVIGKTLRHNDDCTAQPAAQVHHAARLPHTAQTTNNTVNVLQRLSLAVSGTPVSCCTLLTRTPHIHIHIHTHTLTPRPPHTHTATPLVQGPYTSGGPGGKLALDTWTDMQICRSQVGLLCPRCDAPCEVTTTNTPAPTPTPSPTQRPLLCGLAGQSPSRTVRGRQLEHQR